MQKPTVDSTMSLDQPTKIVSIDSEATGFAASEIQIPKARTFETSRIHIFDNTTSQSPQARLACSQSRLALQSRWAGSESRWFWAYLELVQTQSQIQGQQSQGQRLVNNPLINGLVKVHQPPLISMVGKSLVG